MDRQGTLLTILITLMGLGALVLLAGALHSMSFVTVFVIFFAMPFVMLILAPVLQTLVLLMFALHSPTGRLVIATMVVAGLLMALFTAAFCIVLPFESLSHAA